MITKSTPWSITWIEDSKHTISFEGEWTLESKFYLTLPTSTCWDNSTTPIAEYQLQDLLQRLRRAASDRGWIIIIDGPLAL
ncbi:hypothetical protein [Hydrogenophaga sp.]|uniref:hypothetical protein n=1 Tax=Hydrogenophaga sp. TaxID=1904254 RepID=UPI002FC9171A